MNFTKHDNEIDERLSSFSLLLPWRVRLFFCLNEMFNLMHLYICMCACVYLWMFLLCKSWFNVLHGKSIEY
jgi:hypothetical protein